VPRTRLIKSIIDALPTPEKEIVYWDEALPGFGLKITPKGRKVFIVLYRAGGSSGSRLRKYTIGPYGRITLHNARLQAQKVLAARLDGRDPAMEKREARRRITVDTVAEIVAFYAKQHLSKRRSGPVMTQILQRELVERWGSRSVHEVSKRDIIDLITAVVDRGAPMGANHTLRVTRAFFNWCLGRAILERSPCDGVKAPTIAKTRDRVLTDKELASVLLAARATGGSYGAIVEVLALTGQRREEVARMTWAEVDFVGRHWSLPGTRTKNGKTHVVQVSDLAVGVILAQPRFSTFVFPAGGGKPFSHFSREKRRLDVLSGVLGWRLHDLRRTMVSGMARLGVAPHVADKILNHASGTISGVAAVYQRHEFMQEREDALKRWSAHVESIIAEAAGMLSGDLYLGMP
jgi:integrase